VLGIDKSNVTRLCAEMVEAGHLVQAESLEDGRTWRLSLTPRGRRLAERVEDASRSRFEDPVRGRERQWSRRPDRLSLETRNPLELLPPRGSVNGGDGFRDTTGSSGAGARRVWSSSPIVVDERDAWHVENVRPRSRRDPPCAFESRQCCATGTLRDRNASEIYLRYWISHPPQRR
jgi:YD repeat-containing protein